MRVRAQLPARSAGSPSVRSRKNCLWFGIIVARPHEYGSCRQCPRLCSLT